MQPNRVLEPINRLSSSLKTFLSLLLGWGFFLFPDALSAAPPDLTNGGVPGDTISFNMGATGARGWAYHVRENTSESRQIQIKSVAAGSPAAGILAADDVILGADGTGAEPVNFTTDARKALAGAINDAEARNPATLKLIRWRAGTTSTVTLTLQTMGAYSATAPYNCPKSALILQRGLQAIMATGSAGETSGSYSFGTLSLLAAYNETDPNNGARMTRAQNEARALVPSASVRAQMMSDTRDATSMITWERGHKLIVMAEYYLLTGDAQVLPGIEAYAVNIAKNCSLFGTMGHIFAEKNPDGSANGPMGGVYGPVNSAGMPCFLGLLLAKECGLSNPELTPAIERMNRFYGYYAGRGAIPYGEHEAYWQGHESNGKSGLGALCFNLQNTRAGEGKFFAKMATAATTEREIGHTGSFFNYVWAPLGAASGGEEAAASHFSRIRWMLDLNRRWDGKFDYDCLNGEGDNSGAQYGDFRMSTAALLTYALPLRQLCITGKNHDPARYLTSPEVSQAVSADGYSPTSRTISELIADLGSWSPMVQRRAGEQLATRSIDSATLNQLTTLANDPLGASRVGACIALGKISNSGTANARAATLAALLTDPQNHVRFMAAEGMRYLPDSAKLTQINTILTAAASTGKPLLPFDEEDPLQFAHGRLAMLLFYSGNAYGPKGVIWGSKINSPTVINRSLLYPAIRAVAANPVGMARSTLQQTYTNLTAADVNALAGTIVDSVQVRAPSDKMFSSGVRKGGIETLEKFKIAEGVPLCEIYAIDHRPSNDGYVDGLAVLRKYAGGSTTVTPDPDIIGFCQSLLGGSNAAAAQLVLEAIAADSNPAPLTPFKSIHSASADAVSINLPANQTTLRVSASDLAEGNSLFTWRKVHGAGDVTFIPNGSAAAKDCAIQFNNIPGKYLFEVTMSDSRGLTEVYGTVSVTLRNPDGTLPPNNPPVANPQTVNATPASSKAITLSGSDPEGCPLVYSIVTKPANGQLTGTAPNVIYTSNPGYLGADSFTFQVMDSEGQTATATVSINVSGAGVVLHAYDGFDYPLGSDIVTPLDGGTGFAEAWRRAEEGANDSITVTTGAPGTGTTNAALTTPGNLDGVFNNPSVTTSPTGSANRYIDGASGDDRITANRKLSQSAGALAGESKTLWASVIWTANGNDFGRHVGFTLGTDGLRNRCQNVSTSTTWGGTGQGIAIGVGGAINNSSQVTPAIWSGGNVAVRATTGAKTLSNTQDNIVILKYVFADGSTPDVVQAWAFGENETITEAAFNASAISAQAVVDQNALNILSFSQSQVGVETIDEIRVGNSFAAVVGVQGTPPDTTPPTLVSIADDRGGEAMLQNQPVTYTFTFSEAMSAASISAADFNNAGTAAVSIQSVAQPLPHIVNVQVVPTTPGTLQLRIPQGAVLTDLAGNPLNTSTALAAGTVITVNPAMVEVPFVIGLTLAQSEPALTGAGLATGAISYQYSDTVPANQVLAQSPAGGTSVTLGTPVALTVSLGPNLNKFFAAQDIPVSGTVTNSRIVTEASNNTYLSIQEIENPSSGNLNQRRSLLEHKWRFEVPAADTVTFHVEAYHTANTENDDFLFAYSTTGENGTYIDMLTVTKTSDNNATQSFTLPQEVSGTIHVRVVDADRTLGRRVLDAVYIDTLYFQTFNENGPVYVTVPDVVGQMQSAAQSAITTSGLVVGSVNTTYHASIPAGQVLGQNPSGGSSVTQGSLVDLTVSLGPPMVAVPDVVGQSQSAAQSAITAASLVVGTVTTQASDTVSAGEVIAQTPAGGTSVTSGSAVDLVVSLGDTTPPIPATMTFASAPAATSATAITMTATAATDANGVEYRFLETSGNPGGTSSAWQDSPVYTDTGLNPNTPYIYTVQARDKSANQNPNSSSAPASATTQPAAGTGGAIIYEPFDMTAGALAGKTGGMGLGTWNRHSGTAGTNEMITAASGMTYGTLPVTGLRIKNQTTTSTRANNVSIGSSLTNAGLLADGATLWFSVLVQPVTSSNSTSGFALCSGNITYYDTAGIDGVGINIQNGSDLEYCAWKSGTTGTYLRSIAQADLHNVGGTGLGYRPHLVVGKVTWGTGDGNDTFELFMPNTSLTQGARKGTVQSINVDQSTFNRICIYNQGGGIEFDEIRIGGSYESVTGQGSSGPGPLDHFAISAIPSPQTVGMPITGITLTAQDASNQTITSFTGTVNFSGSGGFSGTSGSFTNGVLGGLSVTPSVAGSNLTFTVTDVASGKSGTATIATVQTQFAGWSNGAPFEEDSNGDGVPNGMAFLLGATNKDENASHLLPVVSDNGGALKLTFKCRNAAKRGSTVLKVQYSRDLGITDLWSNHDEAVVPGNAPLTTTIGGVDFVTSVLDENLNQVEATIPASAAASGTSLFGRLQATP